MVTGDRDVEPAPTFRRRLYDILEANNKAGMVLEAIIVLLIIVNVVCFMLSTERSLEDNEKAWAIFDAIEICTVSMRWLCISKCLNLFAFHVSLFFFSSLCPHPVGIVTSVL